MSFKDTPVSTSPVMGLQRHATCSYLCAGDLNSGLHVCVADDLSSLSSPQRICFQRYKKDTEELAETSLAS